MERPLIMVIHSSIIGFILYALMVFALKQDSIVAETHSILIATLSLIYMILFGHGRPTTINQHLTM